MKVAKWLAFLICVILAVSGQLSARKWQQSAKIWQQTAEVSAKGLADHVAASKRNLDALEAELTASRERNQRLYELSLKPCVPQPPQPRESNP